MPPNEDQIYSEKEVAKILRRAADLQDQAATGDKARHGARRADLERIGEEVGIDPRFVAAALAEDWQSEVETTHRGQAHWLGAPPEYTLERTVPGTLTPALWDSLVGLMNEEFKQTIPGAVSGSYHTWQWKHDLGWVHLNALQTKDGIKLKLNLHLDGALIAGLVPTAVAWFAATAVLFSTDSLRPYMSALLSALLFLAIGAAFRAFAGSWWNKDRQRTTRLMARLTEALSGGDSLFAGDARQAIPQHDQGEGEPLESVTLGKPS